jgi:adenylate cyclase
VQVKGKEQPIRIYEPLCPENEATEAQLELVRKYNEAHDFYLQQEWGKAEVCFKALEESEDNKVLYSVYLERIADLRNHALPEDWDGTFRHTTK